MHCRFLKEENGRFQISSKSLIVIKLILIISTFCLNYLSRNVVLYKINIC
jgi:hypothetical protein